MLDLTNRKSTTTQSRNKFVETALKFALTYASSFAHAKIGPASITILADSDYYSHGKPSTGEARTSSERFVDFHVPLQEAHKTGLGSSAALVTAFTAAVVAYYVPSNALDLTSVDGKFRLHNLAQAAHCAAQGKVGSGFDVAAATFGSCVYRRFSPSVLEGLGEVGSTGFLTKLKTVIEDPEKRWDTSVDKAPAVLPKGLLLLMCDVDCGSETVGMVKKVLAWRKADQQDANHIWATIQKGNEDLAQELQKLCSQKEPPDYSTLQSIIQTTRSLIREMSDKAQVPIEPTSSTRLIDRCSQIPGVIGGVVPGAGGFDAIALLVEDKQDTMNGLRKMLEAYDGGKEIGNVRLLGVRQDDQGLKQESFEEYKAWLQ